MPHVTFMTPGIIREPDDDPRVQESVDLIERI